MNPYNREKWFVIAFGIFILGVILFFGQSLFNTYQEVKMPHPSRDLAEIPILEEFDLYSCMTSMIGWEIDIETGKRKNFSGITTDKDGNPQRIDHTTKILEYGEPIND